MTNCDLESTDN